MFAFFQNNYMLLLAGLMTGMCLPCFVLMCVDKTRAVRKRGRRIPERTLLGLSLLFGAFGTLLGMLLLRHKTNPGRHPAFAFGVPCMVLAQGGLLVLLLLH